MGYSFLCIDRLDYNRHQYLAAITDIIELEDFPKMLRWLSENDCDYKVIQSTFYFQSKEDRFRFVLIWS